MQLVWSRVWRAITVEPRRESKFVVFVICSICSDLGKWKAVNVQHTSVVWEGLASKRAQILPCDGTCEVLKVDPVQEWHAAIAQSKLTLRTFKRPGSSLETAATESSGVRGFKANVKRLVLCWCISKPGVNQRPTRNHFINDSVIVQVIKHNF